jgi:hypothetical protein
MTNQNTTLSKILYFNNETNFNEFISKLLEILKNAKKYKLDNPEFLFNNSLCICNIEKKHISKWNSTSYYKIKNDKYNITQNRLILYKFTNTIIYIEKNGLFKLINNIINNLNNVNMVFKEKNINSIDTLHNEINNFLLNTKEKIEYLNNISNEYNIKIPYIENNEYTLANFINLYDDLINNKLIDINKKLDIYNYKDCIDNIKGHSTETKYNELICKKNPDKYINLDIKFINNCEIADIYDKQNKLLFHNKKNKDLRILSCQIINGALILKSKIDKSLIFIKNYNIDIDNFKYVFGIIKEKNNITLPNKIDIGFACHILKKLNIEYYVDLIEYIK